jgi:hypothetical protein
VDDVGGVTPPDTSAASPWAPPAGRWRARGSWPRGSGGARRGS